MADKKGKRFGKLNIVDLLVIIVIVIAVIFVGVKFLGGNGGSGGGSSGKTHVVYTVLVESVEPEVYDNIKALVDAGDATLMASGELLDGKVTAVTAQPHEGSVVFSVVGTNVEVSTEQDLLDLTFTIECNVTNSITTEIGTQEVRIGKDHIVKTNKFELSKGTILDCHWGEDAA